MASARQMMLAGIIWLIAIAICAIFTFLGGVFWGELNTFVLHQPINPQVGPYLGKAFFIEALFYATIVLCAIAATYKLFQTPSISTDYYPGEEGRIP